MKTENANALFLCPAEYAQWFKSIIEGFVLMFCSFCAQQVDVQH